MNNRLFVLTVCLLFVSLYLRSTKYNGQQLLTRNITLYNQSTVFQLFGTDVETKTLTILTPSCAFENGLEIHDCKKYIKMFVDMNCTFAQTSNMTNDVNDPKFLLYLSPETYNLYDSRLQVYNNTNCSWLQLTQGLSCQSNNVCVFVSGFTFSYKNWNSVPLGGNNVTLNCSTFYVYAYS